MALTNEHKRLLNTRIQEIRLGVQDKRKHDRSIGIIELISIDTFGECTSTINRSAYRLLMRQCVRKVCTSKFKWTTDQSDSLFATHFGKELAQLKNTQKAELFLDNALGCEKLQEVWNSETTLGWIHQFWHLSDKNALQGVNQIKTQDIPIKTQLFSEQYMVDWLLQNTIGRLWLSICQNNGWTPKVYNSNTLLDLNRKRQEWKEQSQLDIPMELETILEGRWGYLVEHPTLATTNSIHSLRELKLLDPACGTGHFLISAMDLMFELYKEERQFRGEEQNPDWSNANILQSIAEHNLHGVDIDQVVLQTKNTRKSRKTEQ